MLSGGSSRAFVHELAHMLLDEAVPAPLARVPAWLNEGLSVYFETADDSATRLRLNRVARRDQLPAIRTMNSVPGNLSLVSTFYAKSGNFVAYLIEDFGRARMSDLIAELNQGTPPEDAIEAVYGLSLDALDARWEAQFYGDPVPTPDISPPASNGAPDEAPKLSSAPASTPKVEATRVAVPAPGQPRNSGRDARGVVLGIVLALLGLVVAVSFLRRRARRTHA